MQPELALVAALARGKPGEQLDLLLEVRHRLDRRGLLRGVSPSPLPIVDCPCGIPGRRQMLGDQMGHRRDDVGKLLLERGRYSFVYAASFATQQQFVGVIAQEAVMATGGCANVLCRLTKMPASISWRI